MTKEEAIAWAIIVLLGPLALVGLTALLGRDSNTFKPCPCTRCKRAVANAERVLSARGREESDKKYCPQCNEFVFAGANRPYCCGECRDAAEKAKVTTTPTGIRQTTPSEILKSEKGREAVEKTADLGYEGTFLCRNCESAVSDPVDTREWCRGCLEEAE